MWETDGPRQRKSHIIQQESRIMPHADCRWVGPHVCACACACILLWLELWFTYGCGSICEHRVSTQSFILKQIHGFLHLSNVSFLHFKVAQPLESHLFLCLKKIQPTESWQLSFSDNHFYDWRQKQKLKIGG